MSELIHNFGIDWKLLLAQAVNFLILLFILKRFAYEPILKMLRSRKEGIEKGYEFMREADERLRGVDKFREDKMKEANQEALLIVKRGEESGKERQAEIIVSANKKAESVMLEAKRIIGEERAKLEESVSRDAEVLVRSGLEKVLGKVPAEVRDKELIHEAMRELKVVR
ncbi:MAG: hypothetical protein HYT98_00300 [Candidatus Sungbacteria bacterium]|nr:hypothetical protein [Candidatus Sungbacteria bacterium]